MISKMFSKLSDPEYRKAFVASQINIGIPFQIRALLKSRGWKQEDLARRTGMLQPRISALLTPGKVHPNIETLRRIAEALDCGLEVRFVQFSELVHRSESFDPENFSVPTFDQEIRQAEEREDTLVAALPTHEIPYTIFVSEGALIYPRQFQASASAPFRGAVSALYGTNEERGAELVYLDHEHARSSNLLTSLLPPQLTQQERAA